MVRPVKAIEPSTAVLGSRPAVEPASPSTIGAEPPFQKRCLRMSERTAPESNTMSTCGCRQLLVEETILSATDVGSESMFEPVSMMSRRTDVSFHWLSLQRTMMCRTPTV